MANSIGLVDGNIITASVPVAATAGQVLSSNGTTLAWTTPTTGTVTGLTGEVTTTGSGLLNVTLSNLSVISKTLSGLSVTSGAITSADSILTAMGKIQGQINGLAGGSTYKGTWNAATNTPTIVSSVGTGGDYYIVSTAGTTNINGTASWDVGDWIIFDGTVWQKVDNTDSVTSVNGLTGAVNLTTTNITEGTNLYYTDARSRAAISLTTTGGSGVATYIGGVLNIPNYTLSGLGGVPTTTTLSINGTSFDLSASRSWSVGTVTSVNATVPTGFAVGSAVTSSGNIAITFAPGYSLPTNLLQTNWDTAYNLTLGAALTKTDDTNVTLTLGGTPATSLLRATSLTLGWTGQLAVGRGGSGASTLTGILVGNATSAFTGVAGTANQLLRRNASNTAYEFFTHSFPTGSGTAGQVTFWNGTSSISSSADFTYNDTTKVISVNGVSVGRGANNVVTNTALGASSLNANTSGAQNTSVGNLALLLNTVGLQNSAFGYRASRGNTTGSTNSAFGIDALRVNTTGSNNAAFGAQALDNTTAGNNTAIGTGALLDNTSGASNTALGYRAGYAGGAIANTTGSNNIFIGSDSIGEAIADSNRTFIGNTSTVSTWLGGNLLLGTRTDDGINRLQVAGSAKITGAISAGSGPSEFAGTMRTTNSTLPTTGAGLEFGYLTGSSTGLIISYNRGTSAYTALTINASTLNLSTGSNGTVNFGTGNAVIPGKVRSGTSSGTSAYVNIGINSVAEAQLNLATSGFTPTSPANGDLWFDGTNVKFRISSATTNFITGALTSGYVPKATGTSSIVNSLVYDNGTSVLVNTNTAIPTPTTGTYSHAFQILANTSGGMIVSTTNTASAIGIVNSSSANKTWDISPFNNDLAINESGSGSRMYFLSGGNITVGGITNSGNLFEILGTFKTTGVNTLSNLQGTGSRMVVADANGVLSTQAIPGGNITGTGVSGQVTYWTGASSQAGNAGFTFSPGNKLFLNNTVIAASNVARGFHVTSQLSSFANSEDLVGIDLSPVYTTTGLPTGVHAIGIRTASSFTPTQTDIRYTAFSIQPTIAQGGTATGITRGVHVNPTITSAVDWRSIEWSNSLGWGLYGAGTANNYLGGNLGIAITPTSRLHISGVGNDATTNSLIVQNSSASVGLKVADSGDVYAGDGAWFRVQGASKRYIYKTDATDGTFSVSSCSSLGTSINLFGATHATKPRTIQIAASYAPVSGTIAYNTLELSPNINQTGTANAITRGLYINPVLNNVVSESNWRSVEWSNNGGYGLLGIGSAQNLLNGKLTVSPTVLAANFTNANTISVLGSQVLNIPAGNRGADGNVYSSVTGANYFRFNGATTLFGDALWSGSANIANIQFDTTGTVTMANSATTGYRPLSVMQLQMQASGANSGTVDKGATLFIQGVYPASLTGTVTFTDYAAVRINDLKEWGGTTVVLTNRWGIYQAGADDKNYFAASVGVGVATPVASAKLQVDSTTQGFLPPRMTTTQRNAIVTPAAGLIVYDTDLNRHYGYNGTAWNAFY